MRKELGEGTTLDELKEFLLDRRIDLQEFEDKSLLTLKDLHFDINKKETILGIDGQTGLPAQMSNRTRIVVKYRNFWLREKLRVYPKGIVMKGGLYISGSRIRHEDSKETALRELKEEAALKVSIQQLDMDTLLDRFPDRPKLRPSTTYYGLYTLETIVRVYVILNEDQKPTWFRRGRKVADKRAILHLDWFEGNEFSGLYA